MVQFQCFPLIAICPYGKMSSSTPCCRGALGHRDGVISGACAASQAEPRDQLLGLFSTSAPTKRSVTSSTAVILFYFLPFIVNAVILLFNLCFLIFCILTFLSCGFFFFPFLFFLFFVSFHDCDFFL